ncbi:hypothetical protein ACF1BN_32105 [Streptomyces sp. NPDC014861]
MELADVREAECGLPEREQRERRGLEDRAGCDGAPAPGHDGGHEMKQHC